MPLPGFPSLPFFCPRDKTVTWEIHSSCEAVAPPCAFCLMANAQEGEGGSDKSDVGREKSYDHAGVVYR